jgi:hypothetical protein
MKRQNRVKHEPQIDKDQQSKQHHSSDREMAGVFYLEGYQPKFDAGLWGINHAGDNARSRYIHYLQRVQGNSAVTRSVIQSQEEINFGPEEGTTVTGRVHVLGPDIEGVTVTREIDKVVESMKTCFDLLGSNYLTAIENFRDYMSFSSSGQAQANYLKAAFKFGLEQVLDQILESASFGIKGLKTAYDLTLGLVKAMIDEHERAAAAQEQVVVRDYIINYRTNLKNLIDSQRLSLDPLKDTLVEEYNTTIHSEEGATELGTSSTTQEAVPRRAVAGPGAEFLANLQRGIRDLRSQVERQRPDFYLQRILEAWVRTRENTVESRGGGDVYMGGRIYFTYKLMHDNGNWSVKEVPTTAKLTAPQASQTIDALQRVMQHQNININQIDILKVLKIEVEDEVWGFNDHYNIYLRYYSPDRIADITHAVPSPVTVETVQKAPIIEAGAMQYVDISALNVRRLEEY